MDTQPEEKTCILCDDDLVEGCTITVKNRFGTFKVCLHHAYSDDIENHFNDYPLDDWDDD